MSFYRARLKNQVLLRFVFQEILHINDVKNVLCIEIFAQTHLLHLKV